MALLRKCEAIDGGRRVRTGAGANEMEIIIVFNNAYDPLRSDEFGA